MSDHNDFNRNNAADTPPEPNGYQPPQYTQQYTNPTGGYRPPNYAHPYEPSNEQPVYGPMYTAPIGYPQKSRIAAALLAFMFGTLGVHNFYLGNTGKAVTQLLFSTVGIILLGLGPIISLVWCWYEGIQLFRDAVPTDGHGVPFID